MSDSIASFTGPFAQSSNGPSQGVVYVPGVVPAPFALPNGTNQGVVYLAGGMPAPVPPPANGFIQGVAVTAVVIVGAGLLMHLFSKNTTKIVNNNGFINNIDFKTCLKLATLAFDVIKYIKP